MAELSTPLAGTRVLDFTRLLPGPFATLWLADLGADVLKVEERSGGDWVRAIPPDVDGSGALFHALNRNKRSIAIDLKTPGGPDVLRRLVESADVLVEGFRPGVMDKLGVGYETLRDVNPRLVYCAITGYGLDGPLRDRAGHSANYESYAGTLGVTGRADGPPVLPGVPIADLVGAISAVSGILAALLARERTGRGTLVDISMTDSTFSLMALHLAPHLAGQPGGPRRGEVQLTGAHPNYAVYETADGKFLSVGSIEPKFWAAFCGAIERPDLVGEVLAMQLDPTRGAAVFDAVTEAIASRPAAAWQEIFAGLDCCVEVVLEGEDVLAHPLHRARGMVGEVTLPNGTTLSAVRSPLKPWTQKVPLTPAPALGEHTDASLSAAGYSEADIQRLREEGVIR